jgi:nucleotide-binding universal stress UspA family protein
MDSRTYRIVVGVDGSDDSLRALRWAMAEAQNRSGTVQAVCVYTWGGTEAALLAGLGPEGERRHAEAVLAGAIDEVQPDFPGVSIAAEVLEGDPGHSLADAAGDANLLAVGSHGHGRLHHAVLGSVSEACIRLAHCPVVVLPLPQPPSTQDQRLAPPDQVGEPGTA